MDSDSSDSGEEFRRRPELSMLRGGLHREKTVIEFEEEVRVPERRMSIYDPASGQIQRQFTPTQRIPEAASYRAPPIQFRRKDSSPAIHHELTHRETLPPIAHPTQPDIKDRHVKELHAATAKSRNSASSEEEDEQVTQKKNGLALLLGIIFGVLGLVLALTGMALLWIAHEDYFTVAKSAIIVGAILLAVGVVAFVAGCTVYHVFFKRILERRKQASGDKQPITTARHRSHFPPVGRKNSELPPLDFSAGKSKRKKVGLKRRASMISIEGEDVGRANGAAPKSPGPLNRRVHPDLIEEKPSWK